MKNTQIKAYLNSLSDEQLQLSLGNALLDLKAASDSAPNSEWHQECFAAMFYYGEEFNRRGLKINVEK